VLLKARHAAADTLAAMLARAITEQSSNSLRDAFLVARGSSCGEGD
jgi:hypothetical protein